MSKQGNDPARYYNTISGRVIDAQDPQPDSICIQDIAAGLSKCPRFGGATLRQYSVAEHSMLLTEQVRTQNLPASKAHPNILLEALLHDAAEGYMMDCPSPFKAQIPGYREYEKGVLLPVIFEAFNLPDPRGLPKTIERADDILKHTEAYYVQPNNPWLDATKVDPEIQLGYYPPEQVYHMFLAAFNFYKFGIDKKMESRRQKAKPSGLVLPK